MRPEYELVVAESTAAEFHARTVPEPARPTIWWHRITAPALVLGSTQRNDVVDHEACRAAGVDVVKRRSGGGAVLLDPLDVTWIDVIVPRGAVGWSDDVHAPMVWLGERLERAFGKLGLESIEVHRGKLRSTPWSTLVCFDGVGPGELIVGGRKLVGMSQRRTRGWARMQCCWYSRYDHADLVGLLAADRRPRPDELAMVATVPSAIGALLPDTLRETLDA
jgi:lipoate-protein ligase A